MRVRVDRRWRVDLAAELELPLGAARAWESLRDFRRFACLDIFHREVRLDGAQPGPGAGFVLVHGLAGVRVSRVGRILRWEEGRGYAFSDLSRRGSRAGFPHVYTYELVPLAADRCRFRLGVRGLWTARRLGRPLTRLWLAWILAKTRLSIENAFLRGELGRRRARRDVPGHVRPCTPAAGSGVDALGSSPPQSAR